MSAEQGNAAILVTEAWPCRWTPSYLATVVWVTEHIAPVLVMFSCTHRWAHPPAPGQVHGRMAC